MKMIYGMGRPDHERKSHSFLMSYRAFFTMFPQLWINELKETEGK
jgi:hypothetical protein